MFQSTPPARAATGQFRLRVPRTEFQSTPPARAATRTVWQLPAAIRLFQSTPPARAATRNVRCSGYSPGSFQSTPPARAATARQVAVALPVCCFNPRRPRGRRPTQLVDRAGFVVSIHAARAGGDTYALSPLMRPAAFQSTPPARAATWHSSSLATPARVSIHAARAGGDERNAQLSAAGHVSIHAARAGGDAL